MNVTTGNSWVCFGIHVKWLFSSGCKSFAKQSYTRNKMKWIKNHLLKKSNWSRMTVLCKLIDFGRIMCASPPCHPVIFVHFSYLMSVSVSHRRCWHSTVQAASSSPFQWFCLSVCLFLSVSVFVSHRQCWHSTVQIASFSPFQRLCQSVFSSLCLCLSLCLTDDAGIPLFKQRLFLHSNGADFRQCFCQVFSRRRRFSTLSLRLGFVHRDILCT